MIDKKNIMEHLRRSWPATWGRSLAYFVGAPFWLVKTRLQAAQQLRAEGKEPCEIHPVPWAAG